MVIGSDTTPPGGQLARNLAPTLGRAEPSSVQEAVAKKHLPRRRRYRTDVRWRKEFSRKGPACGQDQSALVDR